MNIIDILDQEFFQDNLWNMRASRMATIRIRWRT